VKGPRYITYTEKGSVAHVNLRDPLFWWDTVRRDDVQRLKFTYAWVRMKCSRQAVAR